MRWVISDQMYFIGGHRVRPGTPFQYNGELKPGMTEVEAPENQAAPTAGKGKGSGAAGKGKGSGATGKGKGPETLKDITAADSKAQDVPGADGTEGTEGLV